MARLHSSLGDRTVYTAAGLAKAQGYAAKVYEDPAGTILANLAAYVPTSPAVPGAAIPGAALVVDPWSNRPAFWDLNDREALYISVAGPTGLPGPLEPIRPDAQPQVTALSTRVGTVEVTANAATRRGTETGMGVVVLTMDDAYIAMDAVRQLLDARGQRATFCITPGLMNDPTTKITNAHILAMVAGGHEIAAHSQTHANFTGLTPAQRKTELQQPKDYLEALIGRPVTTFAYPYGTASGGRNATTDTEVYPLYERVLDTSLNTNLALHPRSSAPPSLIRRTTWDDTNQAQILAMVRQAAVTPVIASIFFHDLGTAVNPTQAQVVEMLDLCASLGVPLVTASQAFGGFRVLGNPSFEDSDTHVHPWHPFTSGAGAVSVATVTPDAGLSGTRALRLAVVAPSTFAYVRQVHSVVPGRTYTLSFRAKVASGTVAQANDAFGRITGVDAGQTALTDTVSTGAPTLTTWAKFSIDYVAPQNAAFVQVDLVVNDVAVPTAVDFDHAWFGPKYLGDWG